MNGVSSAHVSKAASVPMQMAPDLQLLGCPGTVSPACLLSLQLRFHSSLKGEG
jgi:hypothetical protein